MIPGFSGGLLSPRVGSLAQRATSSTPTSWCDARSKEEAPGTAGRVALSESDPPEKPARRWGCAFGHLTASSRPVRPTSAVENSPKETVHVESDRPAIRSDRAA